jgi:hypothetical protein
MVVHMIKRTGCRSVGAVAREMKHAYLWPVSVSPAGPGRGGIGRVASNESLSRKFSVRKPFFCPMVAKGLIAQMLSVCVRPMGLPLGGHGTGQLWDKSHTMGISWEKPWDNYYDLGTFLNHSPSLSTIEFLSCSSRAKR